VAHNPAFLALVEDAKTRIRHFGLDEYQQMLDAGTPHVLIDCREESEWDAGHAAGAIHLGKGVIERDIESQVPDKALPLVIYCGGGFRSAIAADNLRIMGYQQPISLDGGWRAWTTAGRPVEK
jgi:rhodanese-related sulfurtransferase